MGVLGCQFAVVRLVPGELAAVGAVLGVLGCQFAVVRLVPGELAAVGAVLGVLGCQFAPVRASRLYGPSPAGRLRP